jgi:hypothetical protein
MATKKNPRPHAANTGAEEVPPGATVEAADRPGNPGRGAPGSGAGPRHAANDEGSPGEDYGPTDSNEPLADEPFEEPEGLETEAYSGSAGGAVGGTPANTRARGGRTGRGLAPGEGERGDTTIGADPTKPTD